MVILRNWKKKRQQEFCFRCLSSVCIANFLLAPYFIYYEYNYMDKLLYKRSLKKKLEKWDIQEPVDLRRKVHFLLMEGTREQYNRYCFELTAVPFEARENKIEEISNSVSAEGREENDKIPIGKNYFSHFVKHSLSRKNPHHSRLYTANYGLHLLPNSDILAFDVAWAIYLCRVGRRLNYLTKEEARYLMGKAARMAMQSYSSWHEYFRGFYIGCLFNETMEEFKSIVERSHVKETWDYTSNLFGKKTPIYKIRWDNEIFESSMKDKIF